MKEAQEKMFDSAIKEVEDNYQQLTLDLKDILLPQISNCKNVSDIHKEEVLSCLKNVKNSAELLCSIINNFAEVQANMQNIKHLAEKTALLRAQCQQIALDLNINFTY